MADRIYRASGGEVSKAVIARMRFVLRRAASAGAKQRDKETAQARREILRIRSQRSRV